MWDAIFEHWDLSITGSMDSVMYRCQTQCTVCFMGERVYGQCVLWVNGFMNSVVYG